MFIARPDYSLKDKKDGSINADLDGICYKISLDINNNNNNTFYSPVSFTML